MFLNAQNTTKPDYALFEKRLFQASDGQLLPYRILFPEGYERGRRYPLLLFLHGAGERGRDNEAQLTNGASLFLDKKNRRDFPAIVVFLSFLNEDVINGKFRQLHIRYSQEGRCEQGFDAVECGRVRP